MGGKNHSCSHQLWDIQGSLSNRFLYSAFKSGNWAYTVFWGDVFPVACGGELWHDPGAQ